MNRKWVFRWLLSVSVIAIGSVVAYRHFKSKASERVRAEIVKLADDMQIPGASREHVRWMIEQAHEKAFSAALNIMNDTGKKFDETIYVETIFDELIRIARSEGNDDLADTIQEERAFIKFDVQEQ